MHRALSVAAAAAVLTGISACGSGGSEEQALRERVAQLEASQSAGPPVAQQAPSPPAAASPQAVAPPASASPSAAPTVDFVMPNLVGENLQDAQNAIQALGVFFSISHDMLGSRSQVLDSNWKVCEQDPAAGTKISGPSSQFEGAFDLGAVKLTESCP